MAAKKKEPVKKPPAKRGGSTELARKEDVLAKLAEYAKSDSDTELVFEGNKISVKGSKFTYQGGVIGNELSAVILGFRHENVFYDSKFDPDEPIPPACFAIGNVEAEMVPHPTSPKPQCDNCAECPMNQWGSADTGNGKACSNRRRIALLDADCEDIADAEVAMLNIGPSTLKNWSKYVKDLERKYNRPVFGAVTKITFDEDFDYPVLIFEMEQLIDDVDLLEALIARREQVDPQLDQPIDVSNYVDPEEAAPKRRGAPAKAKAGKAAAKAPAGKRGIRR